MPQNVRIVAETLRRSFDDYAHNNKKNPLDELLFILCSVMTTAPSYEDSYRKLRRRFKTYEDLCKASITKIATTIASGGLSRQKARTIKKSLEVIRKRFGRISLSPLKHMTDQECESFLCALPGVGVKVARCVMMYSLGRNVFPVDTHCWRICIRLGWVRPRKHASHPSGEQMDRIQARIPPNIRYSLHVNMVSLGREFCKANKPRCSTCPIGFTCRKVGVSR